MPDWIADVVWAHRAAFAASLLVFTTLAAAAAAFRRRLVQRAVSILWADALGLAGLAIAFLMFRLAAPHIHNLFVAPFVICEFACDFPGFLGTRVYPPLIAAIIWFATDDRRLLFWRRARTTA